MLAGIGLARRPVPLYVSAAAAAAAAAAAIDVVVVVVVVVVATAAKESFQRRTLTARHKMHPLPDTGHNATHTKTSFLF